MKHGSDEYTIRFTDLNRPKLRADGGSAAGGEFVAGESFGLDGRTISNELLIPLTPRMTDLLRIATSVYFVDRLVKRDRRGSGDRWPRRLSCSIEVTDAAFWKQDAITSLVKDALEFVSGDAWELGFKQEAASEHPRGHQLFGFENPFPVPPVVCLYSGGLDSAAGLARRICGGIAEPLIPVVVRHRTDLASKAACQLGELARVFRTQLSPVCTAMSMDSPRELGRCEETSQRTRGFLFVSVGGVVTWATRASRLELYESGIGAINAPLLAGMQGSQATRSAHPAFLEKMSRLLSVVADRQIDVILPFKDLTKGEIVRSLNADGLRELARSTVSCVSYPLRQPTRKSCGHCAACIFRRVALDAAGIDEAADTYQFDILDPRSIPPKKMNYLKAFLNQIDSLVETDHGRLPVNISKHLYQTGLVERGESAEVYVDLYRRYRREWLAYVTKAKLNGCKWANLIDLPPKAA